MNGRLHYQYSNKISTYSIDCSKWFELKNNIKQSNHFSFIIYVYTSANNSNTSNIYFNTMAFFIIAYFLTTTISVFVQYWHTLSVIYLCPFCTSIVAIWNPFIKPWVDKRKCYSMLSKVIFQSKHPWLLYTCNVT